MINFIIAHIDYICSLIVVMCTDKVYYIMLEQDKFIVRNCWFDYYK